MNIEFWQSNREIISGLKKAIDRIDKQDKIIKTLQEKLHGKKEVSKEELMVDYNQIEEIKKRYIDIYQQAPFYLTGEELRDYNEFRDFHKSLEVKDEEGNPDVCYEANGLLSSVIFHYNPSSSNRGIIIVECPYCHTKRKLGTFTDIFAENEEFKNAEE